MQTISVDCPSHLVEEVEDWLTNKGLKWWTVGSDRIEDDEDEF